MPGLIRRQLTSAAPTTDRLRGQTATMTRERYRWRCVGQMGSFTTIRHSQRRCTWLGRPSQPQVFEDARHDAGVGNDSNHLPLAATMGTPAHINSEHPLESRHPTHRRTASSGRAFIARARFR